MLFGRNPASGILMGILELGSEKWPVGRFRDCYPSEDGTKIILFTRNGGGNREEYQGVFDTLSGHPNYLTDYDDDFDCTYASIEFSVPEGWQDMVKKIADQTDTRPPMEKFNSLLSDMQQGNDTAVVSRAKEIGKQLFGAIEKQEDKTISTPDGSISVTSSKNENPR